MRGVQVRTMSQEVRNDVGTKLLRLTLKELFEWRYMQVPSPACLAPSHLLRGLRHARCHLKTVPLEMRCTGVWCISLPCGSGVGLSAGCVFSGA